MGKAVKKSSEEALNKALDKLVMVCPNKKTYDELTSLMFQLYCGNDFGLGNFSLSFLENGVTDYRPYNHTEYSY